jgi:hypothetical protein
MFVKIFHMVAGQRDCNKPTIQLSTYRPCDLSASPARWKQKKINMLRKAGLPPYGDE